MKIDWKKELKFPSLSNISRPSLRRRGGAVNADSPKAEGSSKPSRSRPSLETPAFLAGVKPPKFVADLYADLRDRRLLPLVAVLLIAMIAAPIVLGNSGSGESTPTEVPPIAAGPSGQQNNASFEVVPAENGLRDYRKRLGHRQARNPFGQPVRGQATTPEGGEPKGTAGTEASGGSDSSSSSSASPSSPETNPSTPTETGGGGKEGVNQPEGGGGGAKEESPGSDEPSGPKERGGSEGSGGSEGTSPGSHGRGSENGASAPVTTVVEKITGYAIKAKTLLVGQGNKPTEIRAQEMAKLPDPKQPLAIYLGASEDKGGALFLLGNSVTAYYGGGRCTLDKQSCSVLELRPGKSATLAFGIEEQRYKITLEAIEPEVETTEVARTSVEGSPAG